jgi:PAS domain S-box-containing protein
MRTDGKGGQPAVPQGGAARQVGPRQVSTPPPAPSRPTATPPPNVQIQVPPPPPPEFAVRPRHRAILDSMYEAVFITDTGGTIVEVNARAESITRLSRGELLNQPVSAVVPTLNDDILSRAAAHLETTSHAVVEGWCLQADGDRMRVEIAVSKLDSPRGAELVLSLRNNTRHYAAKMQHANERLMLKHVACGIALVDADSRVQYVNPAFTRMWRREAVVGEKVDSIWPADVAALLAEPLTTGSQWSGEIAFVQTEGPPLSFQANSVPCQDKTGAVEGVIVSFIDITALKAAEEKIRREAELQMEHARHEGNFAGSLNILSMLDLLQLIASAGKTGTLEIMDTENRETSFASFDNGRMVCAACGETLGDQAVEKMIGMGGRLFRFRQDVIRHRDPSMTRTTMSLVLDAVRILDEKKESEL